MSRECRGARIEHQCPSQTSSSSSANAGDPVFQRRRCWKREAAVYVENKGIRFGPVELLQKLKRGEPVDPKLIYFRTVPKFETGAEKYRWLMEHIFVGSAARHADRVVIDVHQVL